MYTEKNNVLLKCKWESIKVYYLCCGSVGCGQWKNDEEKWDYYACHFILVLKNLRLFSGFFHQKLMEQIEKIEKL